MDDLVEGGSFTIQMWIKENEGFNTGNKTQK
jgi:hypothetical protein